MNTKIRPRERDAKVIGIIVLFVPLTMHRVQLQEALV